MNRGEIAQHQSQPLAGVSPVSAAVGAGDRMPLREALEHMIAVTYGVSYDAVVTHFPPYESMLEEIVALVARSAPDTTEPRATRVLDVACGIGNVSLRLAREGYSVVGIDGVRHLVEIAREKDKPRSPSLSFQHFDIAHASLPGAGSFDVLVSMHTLYWHPDPDALLQGCRRALKPGGDANVLPSHRPARVISKFKAGRKAPGRGTPL